jgi:hypothetical protein
MKKLFALVALLTFLTAGSIAQGAALPVEGTWGTSFHNNGFDFDMSFTLQNQSITTTNTCSFRGQTLSVSVNVPARYDGSSIQVLGNAQNSVSENGLNCNVSVEADTMNYKIIQNTIVLSRPGQAEEIVFTRR